MASNWPLAVRCGVPAWLYQRLNWGKWAAKRELGLASAMGLKAEAKIELEIIIKTLEAKISDYTRLTI